MTCEAFRPVTVGPLPGHMVGHAMLVCDLPAGHETLHHDSQDEVWWRHDERCEDDQDEEGT